MENTGELMSAEEKTKEQYWEDAKKIIFNELKNDPCLYGYSEAQNNAQILDLINNPQDEIFTEEEFESKSGKKITQKIVEREYKPARISTILIGVPYAPNALTMEQLKEILGE